MIRNEDRSDPLVFTNKEQCAVMDEVQERTLVDTENVLTLVRENKANKVKEFVNNRLIKERSILRDEITTHRSWGFYKILEEVDRFKIKRLVVYPGTALSLQMHHHRTEHWVVVKGTAKVTIEGKELFLHEGESVYISKSAIHHLENPGKVDLEVIEVQNGEYLGEDDIVRFEDHTL
ncbi:MAG: phosphomannose isomerase type II C-terminal cupin domain [Atribacterota bacterium]